MDQPTVFNGLPVLEIPGEVTRASTLHDSSGLAEVRRWVRGLLPVACPVRDACVLVVSELVANVVEHGGGGRVVLTIGHGAGLLRGAVLHLDAPDALPKVQTAALMEAARLMALDSAADLDDTAIDGLIEEGRGLAVSSWLCRGALAWERVAAGLEIRWELEDCACPGDGSC